MSTESEVAPRRLWRRYPPSQSLPRHTLTVVGLIAAVAYGFFGQSIPGLGSDFYDAVITTFAFAAMALGLNMVVGFAGLLDLGYVAFYAIGAFVGGWLMSEQFTDLSIHFGVPSDPTGALPGIHINFFLVLIIAAPFTAIWGALLGAPTLRLRGDYLAIVTLAFGEIVPRVFELSESGIFGIGNTDFSNGRQGITPIDRPWLPGVPELQDLPTTFQVLLKPYYFIALLILIFVIYVSATLRDSRLGRAWIAVREDEVAAAAMGVNLVRVKLWAYAMGAAVGGMAGSFLGVYRSTVNVSEFEFSISVFILCMVIIGGMGNIPGVLLGAFALKMLDTYGLPELKQRFDTLGIDFDVTSIAGGIFGFFLLVMMVLRPEGFIPSRRRRIELHDADAFEDQDLYSVRA